jgi:3',5'-cyclic AMP phosphodiesterase CpdA
MTLLTSCKVRAGIQLGVLTAICLFLVFFLDNRYRVLPQSIHNHLPVHHPGLVITDITVATCSSLNPLSPCRLDPDKWHRIEKDLYLNTGWVSKAYVHIKRKREEELNSDDKVIMDVKIGRLDPAVGEKTEADAKWENRPAGIWLKRSTKRHDSDSKNVVTAVDILFGADAVEPRPGWEVKDTPLLLDNSGEIQEARLSIRRGKPPRIEKPVPRVTKNKKYKIIQVSDLHLSTGTGLCRDPVPPGEGGKCEADPRTLEFVNRVLDSEKPDFAVLSGDQVDGEKSPDAQSVSVFSIIIISPPYRGSSNLDSVLTYLTTQAIFKFAEPFIHRKIPYATIFGNHDDEGSLSRATQMSLIESLPYSLSSAGPSDIEGVGNYVVEILAPGNSKHSAITLYLLDTHGYSPDERQFRGYDWLKPKQIAWFKERHKELSEARAHKQYTHIHMDMAFIHIPLPEYRNQVPQQDIVGTWKEYVTAPGFNSHFRDALVEAGVKVVSCGHDHANDYCSLSRNEKNKKGELWMCYAGGSGFGGYGGYDGYVRRLRIWEIDTEIGEIKTWKRLEYGETEKRIDEQIVVESGDIREA